MPMSVATVLALAAQCAPQIAPETLLSVIQVESRFDPLAIGVNGAPRVVAVVGNKSDAVAKATALVAAGRSVDLGLAQINSRNLERLDMTLEQAFEPCANLAAAARILSDGYARSDASKIGVQAAIQTALSFYNTGHPRRGFANGYVAKVTNAAERFVPALTTPALLANTQDVIAPPSAPPAWDVFGSAAAGRASFVLTPQTSAIGAAQ